MYKFLLLLTFIIISLIYSILDALLYTAMIIMIFIGHHLNQESNRVLNVVKIKEDFPNNDKILKEN